MFLDMETAKLHKLALRKCVCTVAKNFHSKNRKHPLTRRTPCWPNAATIKTLTRRRSFHPIKYTWSMLLQRCSSAPYRHGISPAGNKTPRRQSGPRFGRSVSRHPTKLSQTYDRAARFDKPSNENCIQHDNTLPTKADTGKIVNDFGSYLPPFGTRDASLSSIRPSEHRNRSPKAR